MEAGALGLDKRPELAQACGALVAYLEQTQKQDSAHLAPFHPLDMGRFMVLDEITERNLELFRRLDGRRGVGTLWQVLDQTRTPMGGRRMEERLRYPWRELSPIIETQAVVCLYRGTYRHAKCLAEGSGWSSRSGTPFHAHFSESLSAKGFVGSSGQFECLARREAGDIEHRGFRRLAHCRGSKRRFFARRAVSADSTLGLECANLPNCWKKLWSMNLPCR